MQNWVDSWGSRADSWKSLVDSRRSQEVSSTSRYTVRGAPEQGRRTPLMVRIFWGVIIISVMILVKKQHNFIPINMFFYKQYTLGTDTSRSETSASSLSRQNKPRKRKRWVINKNLGNDILLAEVIWTEVYQQQKEISQNASLVYIYIKRS